MRLYQNSCGTWCIGMAGNVRRSLKTKDRAQAERLFRKLKRESLMGNVIALDRGKNITLSEFSVEYHSHCEARKRPKTVALDNYSIGKLIDYIGGRTPMTSITSRRLDEFISKLLAAGHAPSGANIIIRHLRAAFAIALKWEYLKANPFSAVQSIKESLRPPMFYSEADLTKIFAAITDDDFRDLITVYLMTGLRRGELSGLRGKDIDFNAGVISVSGKTGWRHIPMTEQIKVIMQCRIKASGMIGQIFPGWKPDSISHKWINLMKKLGIKGRLHDLRHSTASYLVMAGVDMRTIQIILGHSNIATTQIYAHLTQDHARDALLKLGNLQKISTMGNIRVVINNN